MPGIVDQDVDRSERLRNLVQQAVDACVVGHVEGDRVDARPQALPQRQRAPGRRGPRGSAAGRIRRDCGRLLGRDRRPRRSAGHSRSSTSPHRAAWPGRPAAVLLQKTVSITEQTRSSRPAGPPSPDNLRPGAPDGRAALPSLRCEPLLLQQRRPACVLRLHGGAELSGALPVIWSPRSRSLIAASGLSTDPDHRLVELGDEVGPPSRPARTRPTRPPPQKPVRRPRLLSGRPACWETRVLARHRERPHPPAGQPSCRDDADHVGHVVAEHRRHRRPVAVIATPVAQRPARTGASARATRREATASTAARAHAAERPQARGRGKAGHCGLSPLALDHLCPLRVFGGEESCETPPGSTPSGHSRACRAFPGSPAP